MDGTWTSAPTLPPLDGAEPFVGLDATVLDFWRFALSDLRMNNTRGYLAEFLVAKAVGATARRVEWDAFDVLAPSGARIEVKSSAYLQAWDQRQPSRISFTGLTSRTWSPQGGLSTTANYNADVYVFCVQTASRHEDYDPLDVEQWEFYVLSRQQVEALGYKSLGLSTLTSAAGQPIRYDQLATLIDRAGRTESDAANPSAEQHKIPGRIDP